MLFALWMPTTWCENRGCTLDGIGGERQDLLQNNFMLLVQEQGNKKYCMPLVQEQRCRDGLSAWCRFFLFPSFS